MIGLAQALALIWDFTGITPTAGPARLIPHSGRNFHLLSIPVIFGAAVLKMKDLLESTVWRVPLDRCTASFFSAYLCIRVFLMFIRRVGRCHLSPIAGAWSDTACLICITSAKLYDPLSKSL